MVDTLSCAKVIVSIFEENDLLILHSSDYDDHLEDIQLYLAAKSYIERYG